MLGVGVLNWYPNRNPSVEMSRTTGLWSLVRGRAVSWRAIGEVGDLEKEEKKRKAKAMEEARKMQVVRSRKIKRKFLVEGLGGELGSFVSDRRRAVEEFWESSSSGVGVGFDGPRMEREAVPMMGISTSLSQGEGRSD